MEEDERSEKLSRPGTDSQQPTPQSSGLPPELKHEPDNPGDTEEEDNEFAKLDVCSDKFDPLLALYSPEVSIPFPNIKCFNNVAEYEGFLRGGRGRAKPENVEKRQRKAMKGVADPERIERLKKLMVNNPVSEEGETSGQPRRRKQKAPKNVLTRMPLTKGSPLGELYRCVEEKIRVKVHIRTFKGLRGVCSGFVVAFDKFWNMAMVDVDETYREPLLGEALYHEKALTVTRLFEKLSLQNTTERAERAKTLPGKEQSSIPHPEDPKQIVSTAPHLRRDRQCEARERRTDPRLSRETVRATEKDEPGAHVKAERPQKVTSPYGRVHTRHIKQLFIRGENVLLVNLETL